MQKCGDCNKTIKNTQPSRGMITTDEEGNVIMRAFHASKEHCPYAWEITPRKKRAKAS